MANPAKGNCYLCGVELGKGTKVGKLRTGDRLLHHYDFGCTTQMLLPEELSSARGYAARRDLKFRSSIWPW